MLVHDFLQQSAERFPEKCALIQKNTRYSYAEIISEAQSFARKLIEQCREDNFRVAISLPNSKEYVVAYYGTLIAGGCAVPFDLNLGPDEINFRIEDSGASFWVTTTRCLKRCIETLKSEALELHRILVVGKLPGGDIPGICVEKFEFDKLRNESCHSPMVSEDSLATIIYTSGSTGKPKGVMLTHGNLVENTLSIVKYQELDPSDIHMVVLPFHYVMGKSLLNTHFCVGGTLVLNNGFVFPNKVLEEMVEEKVTGFSGVPATYALLLTRSAIRKYREKFQSLRFVAQAGGHLPARLKQELMNILPGHTRIFIMYGATEASARLSYLEPEKLPDKIDSIGKPIPGVTLRIVKNGKELPPGREGEIVASGPNIMAGYWGDAEETGKVFSPFGYHTGDLGYRDHENFFYVTGRIKEMIKVGGNRVSPKEIEEKIWNSGFVREVAVVGVPDDILGEAIKAFVVPENGIENIEEELKGYCGKSMPAYKVPKYFETLEALPKNSAGKIMKNELLKFADIQNSKLSIQN